MKGNIETSHPAPLRYRSRTSFHSKRTVFSVIVMTVIAQVYLCSSCNGPACGRFSEKRELDIYVDLELAGGAITTSGACTDAFCTDHGGLGFVGCGHWIATMTGPVGSKCTATLTIMSAQGVIAGEKLNELVWNGCGYPWVEGILFSVRDVSLDAGQGTEPPIDFTPSDGGDEDAGIGEIDGGDGDTP